MSRRRCRQRPQRSPQRGAALMAVLIVLALLGLAQQAALSTSALDRQREREAELLFIGGQFQRAIASYVRASPPGAPQWPRHLDDLLDDRRHPRGAHHLRRLWVDPFTGQTDWVPIVAGGRLIGVHSRATVVPLRRQGFGIGQGSFAQARTVADWRFVEAGLALAPRPGPAGGQN